MFDVDGRASTGYSVQGMGVDYLLEVSGWENTVHHASMEEFRSSRDSNDWNGFISVGGISAKASGNRIEIEALGAASWMDSADSRFAIALQNAEIQGDWTLFTGKRPGGVQVRQIALGSEGEYMEVGTPYPVLQLDVAAIDVEATLSYLTVVSMVDPAPTLLDLGSCDLVLDSNRNRQYDNGDLNLGTDSWGTGDEGGVTFNMEDSPLDIPEGQIQSMFVIATVGGSANPGNVVKLGVKDPFDHVEAFSGGRQLPVTILTQEGSSSYIIGPPDGIAIDGLFEDWQAIFDDLTSNVTRHEDDLGDVTRSGVDLYRYSQFIDPEPGVDRALFYVETDPSGKTLKGTPFPLDGLIRTVPGPGGGGGGPPPPEPPSIYGEDLARFYIDVEDAAPSGSFFGVQATHMIEVRGAEGVVTSENLWSFTGTPGTPWVKESNAVLAKAGGNKLEVSLDTSGLGTAEVAVVLLTGWDGVQDVGSPSLVDDPGAGSRFEPPGEDLLPIPEFGEIALPVVGTLLTFVFVGRRYRSQRPVQSPQNL
jgi:hypothetical protein